MRLEVAGAAAHGATPWLGDNAILKALDLFRGIESLPFSRRLRSRSTGRRSTSAASWAATRSTRCPTPARSTSTSATCRTGPDRVLEQIAATPDVEVADRPPAAGVRRPEPAFVHALAPRPRGSSDPELMSIGRDGASDAVAFIAPACRRSSSARSAAGTTAPRSGSRSPRWRATGRRCDFLGGPTAGPGGGRGGRI